MLGGRDQVKFHGYKEGEAEKVSAMLKGRVKIHFYEVLSQELEFLSILRERCKMLPPV